MPEISVRGLEMPESPIRKLAPLAAAAKKRGVKFGRPVKELPGDLDEIVRRWERREISIPEISKTYMISESTFYRRLREHRLRKKSTK